MKGFMGRGTAAALWISVGLLAACSAQQTAPTTVKTTAAEAQLANQVLELVNQERANEGIAALAHNATLADIAWLHSADMVKREYFDHVSPDGGQLTDRLARFDVGFSQVGENIAAGHSTASDVVIGWMNSPPHRANILNPDFTQLGVGVVLSEAQSDDNRWTQVFLKP